MPRVIISASNIPAIFIFVGQSEEGSVILLYKLSPYKYFDLYCGLASKYCIDRKHPYLLVI